MCDTTASICRWVCEIDGDDDDDDNDDGNDSDDGEDTDECDRKIVDDAGTDNSDCV